MHFILNEEITKKLSILQKLINVHVHVIFICPTEQHYTSISLVYGLPDKYIS